MKSLAREGDNDDGVRVPEGGCSLVLMPQTLRPATDSEPHTIDGGARHAA
ncbi:hypothetical protein GCM10010272_19540 [Streptomyces lateritius]|nr:hypothetical protein GCM10010272_19540 [Streptomyces lateritius]